MNMEFIQIFQIGYSILLTSFNTVLLVLKIKREIRKDKSIDEKFAPEKLKKNKKGGVKMAGIVLELKLGA